MGPHGGSYYRDYPILTGMKCGDDYHDDQHHRFIGTKEQCTLLHFIFEKLRAEVTDVIEEERIKNLNETHTFEFKHYGERIHRQLFKLCRYVRTDQTYEILITIKKAIEAKVKPYNAIVLGHFCRPKFDNWVDSMDIIPAHWTWNNTRKGYTSWVKWERRGSSDVAINNFYRQVKDGKAKHLVELVSSGKYKEAQSFITKGLWGRLNVKS